MTFMIIGPADATAIIDSDDEKLFDRVREFELVASQCDALWRDF